MAKQPVKFVAKCGVLYLQKGPAKRYGPYLSEAKLFHSAEEAVKTGMECLNLTPGVPSPEIVVQALAVVRRWVIDPYVAAPEPVQGTLGGVE